MNILRAGARPTERGPASWFTGVVLMDSVVEAPSPARVRATRVTFQPGARTAWHRHPLGQTLFILFGVALIGRADGTVERALPGDTVWFDAGERHWHGAAPDALMSHLAIQEADEEGIAVRWEEQVTDEHYAQPASSN
jgi:quercetin dioxygenase-like cupin family protein